MDKSNIIECINKGNINPFDVLGIDKEDSFNLQLLKRKYHEKALVLHPDKTNGLTKNEFQILSVCYSYIKKYNEKIKKKELDRQYYRDLYFNPNTTKFNRTKSEFINNRYTDDQLKELQKDNNKPEINNVQQLNDPELRKFYFIDDDQIDEKTFLKQYSGNNKIKQLGRSIHIENNIFKKNEKFDINKFNAVFEKHKKLLEKNGQIIKYSPDNIKSLSEFNNNNVNLSLISTVKLDDNNEGVLLHNKLKTNKYNKKLNLNDTSNVITKELIDSVTEEDIKMEKKKNKISKIKKNDINDYKSKRPETIVPKETLEEYENRIINKLMDEEEQSMEYISKRIQYLPNMIAGKFQQKYYLKEK